MIAEATGTDGLRTTGRTCISFLLQSFSQAETICLSTSTQPMTSPLSNAARFGPTRENTHCTVAYRSSSR